MILYPAEAKNQWLNPLWILGYHHDIEMSPSTFYYLSLYIYIFFWYTSSTSQGGGGSFKNRKPIGEVGWLFWIRDGRAKPLMDW
jgi:hypothetical protein